MNQVSQQVGLVINRWVGLEPGQYGFASTLEGLWVGVHGIASPYNPNGINQLINCIKAITAKELQIGHFCNASVKC